MEEKKIKGEAKSLLLENGVELTYCELGQENEEVLVCGSFAFITLMPVVKIRHAIRWKGRPTKRGRKHQLDAAMGQRYLQFCPEEELAEVPLHGEMPRECAGVVSRQRAPRNAPELCQFLSRSSHLPPKQQQVV